MTSPRPPRSDPRADGDQPPPVDDLRARGPRASARRSAPGAVSASTPAPPSPQSIDELSVRYAELDLKRRRAEALAEGLAQRVASLEAERRAQARGEGEPPHASARVVELERRVSSLELELEAARRSLSKSETSRQDLEQSANEAWARAESAKKALVQLRDDRARVEATNTEAQRAFAMRIGELDRALSVERERVKAASERAASLGEALERANRLLEEHGIASAKRPPSEHGAPRAQVETASTLTAMPSRDLVVTQPIPRRSAPRDEAPPPASPSVKRSAPSARRSSPSQSRPDVVAPRGAFSAPPSEELDVSPEEEGAVVEIFVDD